MAKGIALGIIAGFLIAVVYGLLTIPPRGGGYPTCVSSPVDELLGRLEKAQAGTTTRTGPICMNAGDILTATELMSKLTNLNTVAFECQIAAVCKNDDPIFVSGSSIEAINSAKFKGLVNCARAANNKFDCKIIVQSAS